MCLVSVDVDADAPDAQTLPKDARLFSELPV